MPGPYSSLMVLRRRASRRPPGPVWTVFGGVEGPVAGVMVVYGPPITHLPPPAVGASPDAAIHDFKGSCRRSVRITVGRSLPWPRMSQLCVCAVSRPTVGRDRPLRRTGWYFPIYVAHTAAPPTSTPSWQALRQLFSDRKIGISRNPTKTAAGPGGAENGRCCQRATTSRRSSRGGRELGGSSF